MKLQLAEMKETVRLLGTDIVLHEGETVYVERAYNQPDFIQEDKWFAWSIDSDESRSVLVNGENFKLLGDVKI